MPSVRQDVKLVKNMSFMHSLQPGAVSLPGLTQDEELARLLEWFAEAVRYSDPVSGGVPKAAETDLSMCVDALRQAVLDNGCEATLLLEKKAERLLSERNRLCKLGKQAVHWSGDTVCEDK